MTLDEFVKATLDVIGEDGVAGFMPTIFHNDEILVIEGIPDGVDHKDAIQHVIRKNQIEASEILFAVASSENQVTVGHRRPGQPTTFILINQVGKALRTHPAEACDWWSILS